MRRPLLLAPLLTLTLALAGTAGIGLSPATAASRTTSVGVVAGIPAGVNGDAPGARAIAVTYTQIAVRAGDVVRFSATGSVRGGPVGSFRSFGPDGAPAGSQDFSGPVSGGSFPSIDGPAANIYSLIGTVVDGTGAELTPSSSWFPIGSGRTVTMPRSGTLAFVVHDALYRADWTRVYDDNVGSFSVDVTVGTNEVPVASLSARPASGEWGEPTVFSTAGTSDPDGQIVAWRLTFGDGAEVAGTGAPQSEIGHVFTGPGTYAATLTVTDDGGGQASRALSATASTSVVSTAKETRLVDTGSTAVTIGKGALLASTILRAALRTTRSGAPVAGRLVTFRLANQMTACVATTDSNGQAVCSTVLPLALAFGYSASFAGDDRYRATTVVVPAITVVPTA